VSHEHLDPLACLGVSRETYAALESLKDLVLRWNNTINLVSKSTIGDIWPRHILDSAQLFGLSDIAAAHWVDMGSGGGFPGLVIAVIARELAPSMRVTLIESDARKATFLREARRELGLSSDIILGRIETTLPQGANTVSARALTSLSGLLVLADRHLRPDGVALFPKGARRDQEIAEAKTVWNYDSESVPSKSDPNAAVLMIRNIHRAHTR
jgi:16S rRNA (guanine527-N7)-methyltransferase